MNLRTGMRVRSMEDYDEIPYGKVTSVDHEEKIFKVTYDDGTTIGYSFSLEGDFKILSRREVWDESTRQLVTLLKSCGVPTTEAEKHACEIMHLHTIELGYFLGSVLGRHGPEADAALQRKAEDYRLD